MTWDIERRFAEADERPGREERQQAGRRVGVDHTRQVLGRRQLSYHIRLVRRAFYGDNGALLRRVRVVTGLVSKHIGFSFVTLKQSI